VVEKPVEGAAAVAVTVEPMLVGEIKA